MSDGMGLDWYEESERDKMNMLDSCYVGNLDEVAMYLNGRVCVNEADEDGVTALQIACAKGYRNLAEFLLKQGADINRANNCGITPFLHACREGHVEVLKLLWNNRADVFRTTGLGVSALTLACAGRHFEVIRMLLYFKLPVNPRQYLIAPTPFMAACFNLDISIIGFLYQNHANVNQKIDNIGFTAEFCVLKCGLQYALDSIKDSQNGQIKQKHDLRLAILNEDVELVQTLIDKPLMAEPLADGLTSLMYAAAMQKHIIADRILRSKQRRIDAQENVIGMTALMFAIISGDDAMVLKLLNVHAKVNLPLTTKLPFNAIDLLQHYSDFKQETLLMTYRRHLNIQMASDFEERQASRRIPARLQLPTALSSPEMSPSSPIGMFRRMAQSFGLSEQKSSHARRDTEHFTNVLPTSHIDWSAPMPFVLAEEILQGDKKPTRLSPGGPDNYVMLARNIALHFINHGDLLKPFPVGFPIDGKADRFRINQTSHFTPPAVVVSSQNSEFGSTQILCTAQRVDYVENGKVYIKNSVSSCPGYLETQHNISATSSPVPKHRSMELNDANLHLKPHRSNGQEKMRNAPYRPNSETQLAGNNQLTYNDGIFNQQHQLQLHHKKHPSATQSLGAELFETMSLNNHPTYSGSPISTPSGSGSNTPILARSDMLHMPETTVLPNQNVSKSANSSPNAYSTINPSDSFRTKYTRRQRQPAASSPLINRSKQKLDIKRLIRQALENSKVDSYYEIFSNEEIDESQFLSLSPSEVIEILARHLNGTENVEEVAAKISAVISQLNNNMMKLKTSQW